MGHKYYFNNEEDAQNWADRVNGEVIDNRHSPGEDWDYKSFDKSFTVKEED